MITIITGPAASGKTTLAKKLTKGKKYFEVVSSSGFSHTPDNCEVIIFDGLTSMDFPAIKAFLEKSKGNMPDLIVVFDRYSKEQLDYWKDKATIITCSNQKSNAEEANYLNHGDGKSFI